MHLKIFFALPSDTSSENDTPTETLDFNSEPKITGPVTWAMKKLLDHKNTAQLAINVCVIYLSNIVQCASGNKNVQTIHYFLTWCL